jgi:hypothetical protein
LGGIGTLAPTYSATHMPEVAQCKIPIILEVFKKSKIHSDSRIVYFLDARIFYSR